ncbi:hypothetical protein [Streptomyces sp. NBC_00425]|uniref:hypothetical protein n=1 Tax=Streptomyces sp. NBC_00425 TaxID=2975740 RepID=UPI002E1B0CC6
MPIQTGPCEPWPTKLCCTTEGVEAEDLEFWTMVASQVLWGLSGRRWGPCPVTVRPCRKSCMDGMPSYAVLWQSTGPWIPYIDSYGQWRNASVCGCRSDCSCGELCEVYLAGPVHDVQEVTIGGDVIPPEAYRVDNNGMLVRTDGECWPDCQDMGAPAGAENTFVVRYRYGLPLDESATAAVSELVCHLLKGCGGGSCGCKSNRNMTRVSRQGVDYEWADPTVIYSEGRTGLPLVDMWLNMVNPYRLSSPSRVYSPDFKRPRFTSWP